MAKSQNHTPRSSASHSIDLPPVRLEIRNGIAKPIFLDLSGEEFLIGSVAGCDLRLPGTNLPPVVCLILRQPDGVRLRKLAPNLPVLHNGQDASATNLTSLNHGDTISVGAIDIILDLKTSSQSGPTFIPVSSTKSNSSGNYRSKSEPDRVEQDSIQKKLEQEQTTKAKWVEQQKELDARTEEVENRFRQLEIRQREIEEREKELEADRILWYRRREEIEKELEESRQTIQNANQDIDISEQLRIDRAEIARQQRELFDERAAWERRRAEFEQLKAEIDRRREELENQQLDYQSQLSTIDQQRHEIEQLQETFKQKDEGISQQQEQLQQLRTDLILREDQINLRLMQVETQATELIKKEEEFSSRLNEFNRQQEAFNEIRQNLHNEYRTKRDELVRFQETLKLAQIELAQQQHQGEQALLRLRQETEAELYQRRQQYEREHFERIQNAEEELRLLRERKERILNEQGMSNIFSEDERKDLARLENLLREKDTQIGVLQSELEKYRNGLGNVEEIRQSIERECHAKWQAQLDDQRYQFSERDQTIEQLLHVKESLEKRLTEFQSKESLALSISHRDQLLQEREDRIVQREYEFEEIRRKYRDARPLTEAEVSQYQADLVRLDRLQATLQEKEEALKNRAMEIDRRWEQTQKDLQELETQIQDVDARQEALRAEEIALQEKQKEVQEREYRVNERTAQLEGQQTMLATLRTRLEQLRDEVQKESVELAEVRSRHLAVEEDITTRQRQIELLREQMNAEKQGYIESSRLFQERSALMQQAVWRMREVQQNLAQEEEKLRQWSIDLEARTAQNQEQTALLKSKFDQLQEMHQRLEADRESLRQRESTLLATDGTRGVLQEQLRKRAEELAIRERELTQRAEQLENQVRLLGEQADSLESLRQDALQAKQQTVEFSEQLAKREEQLRLAESTIGEQKKLLEETQAKLLDAQKMLEDRQIVSKEEIESLRESLTKQTANFLEQIPHMELRVQDALNRTSSARDHLRNQVSELHFFAKQSQEDLETLRSHVQSEMERLREQESNLNRSRSEHRLAVTSFRQQLLEWQSRFGNMKETLSRNESRIGRREAQVEATSQQLAKQVEELQVQKREVSEKRTEIERHLHEMREWYRKKLRELVASKKPVSNPTSEETGIIGIPESNIPPTPTESPSPNPAVILSLANDLDPADKRLGELLRSLELVDAETLVALWGEARRQRRPLRQVLLAGGYLTLYQLALIESGSVNKLMLGRFRVIDRLVYSSKETIYRVHDAQLSAPTTKVSESGICILRHLGEAEMSDPIHPDEYRQRFSAVRDLAHPNISATLEVLEINNRPAVVQEWLSGLPGGDWPQTASVSGVWFRLVSQAALGLHTAHQAGLIHGRLAPNSFMLTADGVVKIVGLGEPYWLATNPPTTEPAVKEDLMALGQAALLWSGLNTKNRRAKIKTFAPELQSVLLKLGADIGAIAEPEIYPNVAILLDELDQIGGELSSDRASWEKLLEYVKENKTDGPLLRQSA